MREAIINLSDEELKALGFGELVTMCREAGIRAVELLEDEGTRSVPQVELEERLDEDRLASLECVEEWDLVSNTGDSVVYIIEVRALALPEQAAEDHEDLVGMCDPTVVDQGLLLSLVGSQETIRRVLRNFEAAGVVPDLTRLGDYDGGASPLDALTDRQLEVLQTAYEMGFYDVPRQTTTDEIAAEIGIDGGTVSEHLQRAERNILTRELTT